MIVVIVCAVLGGLVTILAVIYAYIYFTRIRPQHHRFSSEDRYVTRPTQQVSGQTENEDNKRLFQPFLIWSYANRVRRENNGGDDKI